MQKAATECTIKNIFQQMQIILLIPTTLFLLGIKRDQDQNRPEIISHSISTHKHTFKGVRESTSFNAFGVKDFFKVQDKIDMFHIHTNLKKADA